MIDAELTAVEKRGVNYRPSGFEPMDESGAITNFVQAISVRGTAETQTNEKTH